MKKSTYLFTLFLFLAGNMAFAQISGVVSDADGEPLIGVSVYEKGTANGTVTGINGDFMLTPSGYPTTLVCSYVGFTTQEVVYEAANKSAAIVMAQGIGLDEVVITGTRGKPRTILDSPVPIDNINVKELKGSGKPIIERMLTFKVPSFNSQNQAISDATAHYDPADLRGLGPSRTLVLVNGKRKNQSAQVYLNRTPGKGEVGIDLKSIPTAAIERIEVLRDGASAQYGSDAIAGVINMVLKKNAKYTTFSAATGITSQGDGFNFAADFNKAFALGEDGGYANLTLGFYNQDITNRAGEPGAADLPEDARPAEIKFVEGNPDIGMHVGQPKLTKGDIFLNVGHPLGDNAEFYTFHGMTAREGQSFAYYRAPYWRRDVADAGFITRPEDFIGYQPTFETTIIDFMNSMGVKFDVGAGFRGDISLTHGSNDVSYEVNNSVNRDYLADFGTSPRTFHPGGYTLRNLIGNLDLSKSLTDQINLAVGAEYKKEYFTAIEGNPLSYYKGGSDSFAGIKPDEAGEWNRDSKAAYAQLDYDITDALLVGVAGRFEDFSDFGSNFSYKANARYKIGNGAIRASYSTGFRAPTLHQRYLTNSQYIIVAGSTEPLLQGTLANDNPAVQALGVPELFAETSQNISAGITYKINNHFSASADFYTIAVDDRVLFSSQIGALDGDLDGSDAVEQILIDNNVVAVQFFINAGNTVTTGADIVLNYNSHKGFRGILAANFNTTTIDAITTPQALKDGGYNIFDRQEQGLIINSRPRSKFILGLAYDLNDWSFELNNTMFGPVTVTAPSGGFDASGVETANGEDQELSSQLVTDLKLGYNASDSFTVFFMVNNLLDAYPDETLATTNTAQAGTRFIYSSEVQQQGQLGMNFLVGMNLNF